MAEKSLGKFIISIVLPSLLTIVLFIVSFYLVLIPMFEKSMMERKKEMILELTNTAWSVLEEYNAAYENKIYSLDEAKVKALTQIDKMRYGSQHKDYFWIIDHQPRMIMHPYRKELINADLSDYIDSHEKKLFVDAVKVVDSLGQGFIEYYWQWKDDETKDVPKLSFVKEFKAWHWILGTGIYLEDVSEQISILKQRLLKISGIIVSVIIFILIYVIRQSLAIENKRRSAEENLERSRLKYKSLVKASTEGTLMFIDGKVTFANEKFIEKYFQSEEAVIGLAFNDLFTADINNYIANDNNKEKSLSTETQLVNNNEKIDIVISISKVNYADSYGFIVVVKNISPQRQIELSSKKLSDEVEFSLQLMHQSIEPFIKEILYCDLETSINEAASLMHKKNERVIFVRSNNQAIGVVNNNDLLKRVLSEGVTPDHPISSIMTSPVYSISADALIYEASLTFKSKNVSHLLAKDDIGELIGKISYHDCLEVQHNSLSYLIQQINSSNTVKELKELYSQLPLLISALVSSSDNIHHITRLITTISDSITGRVIEMGMNQFGEAPCKFAFIAMGSAGRSEQTLKTDQDNAIIFEDGYEDSNHYFLDLATYINDNLNFIGYHNCKGQIMAKNPKWCQPLNIWINYFEEWIQNQNHENILNFKIFFDLKYIFGHKPLVDNLRHRFTTQAKENSIFLYQMATSIIKYPVEISKDPIDLKKMMIPFLGYLRINALYAGINETNSMKRLYELFDHKIVDFESCEEIEKTYEFLMHQRIKHHARQIIINESPVNEIYRDTLTSIELSVITKIGKQIQKMQRNLGATFRPN